MADLSSGFSGNLSFYDINGIDLQDAIHLKTNVPYHPDYYTDWRLALGGGYENNYTEFSK